MFNSCQTISFDNDVKLFQITAVSPKDFTQNTFLCVAFDLNDALKSTFDKIIKIEQLEIQIVLRESVLTENAEYISKLLQKSST